MRITVLGGCGAWPAAGKACSGYLIEQEGFRLLLDPGYATLPRLLAEVTAGDIDAVVVSHGHPDHCADLNPLLRARVLDGRQWPTLPVYAPAGALEPVLSLDTPGMLAGAYQLHPVEGGGALEIGPFRLLAFSLPHFVPNLGFRLTSDRGTLAYTGDTGPSPDIIRLAAAAEVFLAEATYASQVPTAEAAYLSSARQAAENAVRANVCQLVLTHLWPGSDPTATLEIARHIFPGPVAVAESGLTIEVGR